MSRLLSLHFAPPPSRLPLRLATSPRRLRVSRPLCDTSAAHLSHTLRATLQSATGSQLGMGSLLGFAIGYSAKRVGQLLLVIAGMQIVAVQLMARRQWLVVDWDRVAEDLAPRIKSDRVDWMLDVVKFRVPFAGALVAGCYAGFRWT
ncbi:unnamed protein product [Chondrus crispus]|uniref:FUN14 family protein n=1 Tax=Chondrus crispus TaxID=2769 RepID=R7QJE0_CHOCR|nr:unnamed protein product [Chondrus crispus]CDF38219.1 unnamed protein product [Chondrus crispus]|eukprot:XP_005718104.1 unnamed protein product [Chondrus crispus]